jgi:hypothetical protein
MHYLPDISIQRGGIVYPKFSLDANALPVMIQGGEGIGLRFMSNYGYKGRFNAHLLEVGEGQGWLRIHVVGVIQYASPTGDRHMSTALAHIESLDKRDTTGILAAVQLACPSAPRLKPSGRSTYGTAVFRLELFRPRTVAPSGRES